MGTKPATYALVFFSSMEAGVRMLKAAGIFDLLGLTKRLNSGGPSTVGSTIPTGSATGQTLFGMYNVLGDVLQGFYTTIFASLDIFARAGAPEYIINFTGTIFTLVIAIAVVSFVRGWSV